MAGLGVVLLTVPKMKGAPSRATAAQLRAHAVSGSNIAVLFCTALHGLRCVLHCTALHCTALHCTACCCCVLRCTVLHTSACAPADRVHLRSHAVTYR